MKQIAFLGAAEKSHLLLVLGKVLVKAGLKVLLVDSTIAQTVRGYIPSLNTKPAAFVTEFEGLDVAAGFINRAQLEQYFQHVEGIFPEYDLMLIDTDHTNFIKGYELPDMTARIWCQSLDKLVLQKNAELMQRLCLAEFAEQPLPFSKLTLSVVPTTMSEAYFESLQTSPGIRWQEPALRLPLDEGNVSAMLDNQHHERIVAKRLSGSYQRTVQELFQLVSGLDRRTAQSALKRTRRERRGT
ncbi:hypothetical protein [Cohnella zeiphila]|uniref:Uncharacterized protein n=1 Tax=Cohnella zeiphila TaxID=2761120 RepID=A0A7X0VWS1_9BACL|nr:hypothetical protein [Cohnella zeiphila]MBB6732790.1 hypothetical protein [Cohnella zeiphila]